MANAKTQSPSMIEISKHYVTALAHDASDNIEYVGLANIGTAKSGSTWQIRKLTWSGSLLTDIQWEGGNETFDAIWDNRASLAYS